MQFGIFAAFALMIGCGPARLVIDREQALRALDDDRPAAMVTTRGGAQHPVRVLSIQPDSRRALPVRGYRLLDDPLMPDQKASWLNNTQWSSAQVEVYVEPTGGQIGGALLGALAGALVLGAGGYAAGQERPFGTGEDSETIQTFGLTFVGLGIGLLIGGLAGKTLTDDPAVTVRLAPR